MRSPRYIQFRGAVYEIYPREERPGPSRTPRKRYHEQFEFDARDPGDAPVEAPSLSKYRIDPKALKVLEMCDSKGIHCQRALDGWYINFGGGWDLYEDDEAILELARL